MTTITDNNSLVESVKNYYTKNENTVRTKSRFKIVHEIHKELGWGTLKNSFLAKICHIFSLMTPKAAKIAKALRVYKFNSYKELSDKIKEIYTDKLDNKSNEEISILKNNALKVLIIKFPQFSIEELDYIIESIDTCNSIIIHEQNADFETKNTLWKNISKNVHEKNQVEHSSYFPPKKLTDEVILAEIEDYYKNDHSKSSSKHKSSSEYALNQIHKNLGLGNLYKSTKDIVFEFFVPCTPQSSKYSVERISDALGVYKVNTLLSLLEEIKKKNISKDTDSTEKKPLIESLIKTFPQFSAEEAFYIVDNLEHIKDIVGESVNADFSVKASAWKRIINEKLTREIKLNIQKEKKEQEIEFIDQAQGKALGSTYNTANNHGNHADLIDFDAFEGTVTSLATFPQLDPLEICTAKVAHNFEGDFKLAICLSTDWSKPLLFKDENNYWNGEIPHNLEFKFVKIDRNNKIVAWEKGKNRQLTLNEKGIILQNGELQFETN